MNTDLISVSQLQSICKKLPAAMAVIICDAINTICSVYGMSKLILHEFLANVIHESAEFTRYEENLNYSVKRLLQV